MNAGANTIRITITENLVGRNFITSRDVVAMSVQRDVTASPGSAPVTRGPKTDDYNARVMKYIPAEVVAINVFLQGIIGQPGNQTSTPTLLWIAYGPNLLLTTFYSLREQ